MSLRSFVRRKRTLSKNKQTLLRELLPKFRIELEELPTLLAHYDAVNLEIGFGKGDFLAALALDNPKCLNIGCDPYIEGVASLLQKINQQDITNIMIWPEDVILLFSKLINHSIDNIYILFPDPWSKRKQKKRRLINNGFIEMLSHKLKSHGMIFIATDHHDYANAIYSCFEESKMFICQDISSSSTEFFKNAFMGYYKKNIEGREIKLFQFKHYNTEDKI